MQMQMQKMIQYLLILETHPRQKIFNYFFNSNCIKQHKFMTGYWRVFSTRTSWLIFEKQMSKCNFNLLMFILKTHNFKSFRITASIKKKLIEYYDKLIFNCKLQVTRKEIRCPQILGRKWREEGKGFIDLKNTSIDTIINMRAMFDSD